MLLRKNGNYQIIEIVYNNQDVIITLDTMDNISISINAYLSLDPLVKGQIINDEVISKLYKSNEKEKLLETSYNLLSKKLYTCYQLRKKLTSISDDLDLLYSVIAILIEKGYLNDVSYAYQYASTSYEKNKGWNYISLHLKEAGISDEVLDITRNRFNNEFEEKQIKQLVHKLVKGSTNKSHQMQLANIYRNLVSKGYNEVLVEQVLTKYKDTYNFKNELENAKKEYTKLLKKFQSMDNQKEKTNKIYQSMINKGFKSNIIKEVFKEVDIND